MSKLQILGLALVATLALGAMLASSASAEEAMPLLAEWLNNGVAVVAETFTDPGEFVMGEKEKLKARCSLILDGEMLADGKGNDTKILTLAGVEVTLAAPALCKSAVGCEENATDIEVAPENLPWKILAFLSATGEFLELVEGETWDVICLVLGVKISIECTSTDAEFELLNVAGGVEVMGVGKPLGTCPGGANTFESEQVPGSGDESTTGALTVSST
jgi:hypothetical protein